MPTTITITFSDNVEAASCFAAVNSEAWVKTGDRTGYVADIEEGKGYCHWSCKQDSDNNDETFTITLGEPAVWASPNPKTAVKTRKWVPGWNTDTNYIYV